MRRAIILVGIAATLAASFFACGGNDDPFRLSSNKGGTDGGKTDAAKGGTTGTGGTGGSGGTGASSGGTGGDAASDALTPGCDPSEQVGSGVFASPAGSDLGTGTSQDPVATISVAAKLAAAGPKVVYLDQGSYAESLVVSAPSDGVTIRGGWKRVGVVWERDCGSDASDKTVIDSPTNVGVKIDGVSLTLDTLSVKTKPVGDSPDDAPGESVYGVYVVGDAASVALNGIRVAPGKGGMGGIASKAAPGLSQPCDGLSNCSDGANGAAASPGVAASAGTFTALGYSPGDGIDGSPGNAGHNGTQGGPGSAQLGCKFSGCTGFCGSFCADLGGSTSVTGSTGTCGCGGVGGAAGGGGRGGGGSVALFVSGKGAVNVTSSTLAADIGGDGSPGAVGTDGSTGTSGAVGTPQVCLGTCYSQNPCGSCLQNSTQVPGGAAGGKGGYGGPGGIGGGGAGGPSIAVVRIGGAVVLIDSTSTTTFALGGKGAGSAPAGLAEAQLIVP